MKHLFKLRWALLFLLIFTYSCTDNDDIIDPPVSADIEIQDFIWKSMNYWYYWQEDVNDLADDRFSTNEEYINFLSNYSNPENLFNHLKYTEEDDFSWYIEDVDAQLNAFKGISESFGVVIKPQILQIDQNENDVVVFVAYVIPDSPAAQAGVKRGDLIYKVNGSVLTVTNLDEANQFFFPTKPSISFGIGEFQDGSFVANPNEININAEQLSENPVHHRDIIEENGKKIGYLVYNAFTRTYNEELNNVFTEFKNEGINELILDLRYNGGGDVNTAAFLASMIDGRQPANSSFSELRYNNKRNNDDSRRIYPFFDNGSLYDKTTGERIENQSFEISRLNTLNRLYVITSKQTASASELIINGLRPFMDVILVGEKTVGKNDASITVVDAPADSKNKAYTNFDNRNPNHTIGLQPIVSKTFNSVGESDYDNGFEPNITIEEFDYAANILPFGDPNEIMLRTTLDAISGISAKSSSLSYQQRLSVVKTLKGKKFSTEMYITPSEERLIK